MPSSSQEARQRQLFGEGQLRTGARAWGCRGGTQAPWLGDPGIMQTLARPIAGLVSRQGLHRPGVGHGQEPQPPRGTEEGAWVFLTNGEIHIPISGWLLPRLLRAPPSFLPRAGPQAQGRAEVSWKRGVDSALPQTAPVALSHPGSRARPPAHCITGPQSEPPGPRELRSAHAEGKFPADVPANRLRPSTT